MIAYVDSFVLIRFILEQPEPLVELVGFNDRVTSLLSQVECMRAIEVARLRGALSLDEAVDRRRIAYAQLRRMRRLPVSLPVLRRAADTFAFPIRTRGAIHLASALMVRDRGEPDLVFATHDHQLGRLAAALGFPVIGCD